MAKSVKYKIKDLEINSDPRGWFLGVLKAEKKIK